MFLDLYLYQTGAHMCCITGSKIREEGNSEHILILLVRVIFLKGQVRETGSR